MSDKEVKRGYVKWEDETGFHKEPLYKHPDLLANASVEEQIAAEEVRRLNEAAEEEEIARLEEEEQEDWDVLEALRSAPEEVLTAAQLEVKTDLEAINTIRADKLVSSSVYADSIESNSILTTDATPYDHSNDRNED